MLTFQARRDIDHPEGLWSQDLGMPDRRRVPRTRIRVAAKVIAGHPPRTYDCLVVDISSLGARVESPYADVLPSSFELTFDSARTLRLCHVA
jgi:hypothetical protein